jgi:BlaI family transcriptional regulator, penicillinase repressor
MSLRPRSILSAVWPRRVDALGRLERRLMEDLWRRGGEARVRDVHEACGEGLAYTTVMTTLDRLHRKGLLDRRTEGRAYVYAPRVSRSQFEGGMVGAVVAGLLGRGGEAAEPVLSSIVDAVSDRDRELLDDLERLVREKRRRLRERGRR